MTIHLWQLHHVLAIVLMTGGDIRIHVNNRTSSKSFSLILLPMTQVATN